MKANGLCPITSEFLEKSGFKRQEHTKHNDVEYRHIFHSEVYGDIALTINLTHKDYSMEASRLPTFDGRGYSSWWLPNPMYVYQLEKIFDLLEVKINL